MPNHKPHKLAIVQDWLSGFAGGESVVLALHEMYPDAPIYTSIYNKERTPQFAKATVITSYLQKIPTFSTHPTRYQLGIPLMPQAFESFDLKEFDTVLSVGSGLSKGVITHPGQRHISYCHTPIRYVWKLGGDTRNEGHFDSGLREWAAHHLRMWDVSSAQRVDTFLANSGTIRDRIAKIYRMPSTVVYPPVHTDRFAPSTDPKDDYFVCVSRLIFYKRIDVIIKACLMSGKRLKIVGTGPEEAKLRSIAGDSPLIEFTGRVSDDELNILYTHAQAFLFASEEDFGIVAVEAMSAGTPVIAYGKGGVTESVIEGKTGTFFENQAAESLAPVLENFEASRFDTDFLHNHAKKFDISVFQEKMREIINGKQSTILE
jgi:glycosyltransferase involved in cell wall biosynthesis